MDRESAWALLTEFTKTDSLRKHALAVEAAMRAYARKFHEPEEDWAVIGLLHDFDYEAYPEQHPKEGARILKERGYPEEVVYAISSHADSLELPRRNPVEKTLYAVDELTGLVIAVALVRPSKKIADVDAPAVRRKMKDKAFARAVDRGSILRGAEEMGVDLDEHITFVIGALQGVASELGL